MKNKMDKVLVKIIGLTGGIASGKTTVAKLFEALGATVIDADAVTHSLYEKRLDLVKSLSEAFGKEILTPLGKIDRLKLGALVFADASHRKKLETLVHPIIREEIQNQIEEAKRKNPPLILVEAALLVETGYYKQWDGLIVVKANPHHQEERLMQRNSFSSEEAKERIGVQISLADRLKAAHWVIDNSGSLEETERQVKDLYQKLLQN